MLNENRPYKDYFDPQDCNRAKLALGQKVYNDFINLNFLVKIPKKSKVKLKIPFVYKIEDCTSKEVYKFLENHKYYFEVTYQMDKELISSFFPKQLDSMAKQGYYPYYNKIRSNRTQLNVEGNLWHIVK